MKRIAIKLFLVMCGVLLALLCLYGCMQPSPVLTVTANPTSIHPPGDIAITAVCSQEGGMFTLTMEGEDPVESADGTFTGTISGWPWKATVTWTDGTAVAETAVRITLENETVVPHGLWSESNTYADRGLTEIDLRYIPRGCTGSGETVFYTGFEDPDGDSLKYRVEVEDMTGGVFESVFYGDDRTLMGQTGFVDNPIFYWFVNCVGEEPIYQYEVWSPLDCQPTPTPSLDGEATREKRIHIYVLEVECNIVTHWAYTIFAFASGCL